MATLSCKALKFVSINLLSVFSLITCACYNLNEWSVCELNQLIWFLNLLKMKNLTNCTNMQTSMKQLLSVNTLKAQLQRHQQANRSSRPGEALGVEPATDLKWLRNISDGQRSDGVLHPKVASRRLSFAVRNPLQQLIIHLLLLSSA